LNEWNCAAASVKTLDFKSKRIIADGPKHLDLSATAVIDVRNGVQKIPQCSKLVSERRSKIRQLPPF
jgi:hypothetical protein